MASPSASSALDEIDELDHLDDPLRHPLVRTETRISRRSSVLAIVPHFQCEPWLGTCLDSLLAQTHPLDGIVVIDDASGNPPVEIVRRDPRITLLTTEENGGPYRIFQAVIENTNYDAYLFQDADDWTSPQRLELLLKEAERTGAEMVGCQGRRLISAEAEVAPMKYPLDVNAALIEEPKLHVVMHPSCVISRDLVFRTGGYATGLRFGGDTEFEHRAAYVGRIVNIPRYEYFVRSRENSLTTSQDTGLQSPERVALKQQEFDRAYANAERVAAGKKPDLSPMVVTEPATLIHVTGPRLRAQGGGEWPL